MKAHSKGIHHITAVAGDPKRNLNFYAGMLGLRLVKKTVNFDDPSAYHLYYGDGAGNPGSILTFFPYPELAQGYPDVGQAVAISFSIPTDSVNFWMNYLNKQHIDFEEPFTRFDKTVIGLQDPDDLYLELIADAAADRQEERKRGVIPPQHSIRGIHGVTLAEGSHKATGRLLTEILGFKYIEEEFGRHLYSSGDSFGSVIEIIEQANLNGRPGKGTVHHIAFRASDNREQLVLRDELSSKGYYLTEVRDRMYFNSIYFHEPGGILFEIATDQPGFLIDEEPEELGKRLMLPPWLEEKRSLIEADLPFLT